LNVITKNRLWKFLKPVKKSQFLSTGYCDHQEEHTHHHICLVASYSIAACSVLRCIGGFGYSPHSKRKEVNMMLSKEYRERIERQFHAFCKAVLHKEACNYERPTKRETAYSCYAVPIGRSAAPESAIGPHAWVSNGPLPNKFLYL